MSLCRICGSGVFSAKYDGMDPLCDKHGKEFENKEYKMPPGITNPEEYTKQDYIKVECIKESYKKRFLSYDEAQREIGKIVKNINDRPKLRALRAEQSAEPLKPLF